MDDKNYCMNYNCNCDFCPRNGGCVEQGMDGSPIWLETQTCIRSRMAELAKPGKPYPFAKSADEITRREIEAIVDICRSQGISSTWGRDASVLCWDKPKLMDNIIAEVVGKA